MTLLHCSNDSDRFIEPLLQEYFDRGIKTYLRGDSGFSTPKLYETCERNGCSYAIRLKQNGSLIALASDKDEALYKATKDNQIDYAVTYSFVGEVYPFFRSIGIIFMNRRIRIGNYEHYYLLMNNSGLKISSAILFFIIAILLGH